MCALNVDRVNPYPPTIHFVACRRLCSNEVRFSTRIPTKRKTGLGARERSSPSAMSHLQLCNWPLAS